jgi:hypothetical protein
MELHQTKKHMYKKVNNQQSEEIAYIMEENICNICIHQ